MSDNGFSKFVPGFEFLQDLVKNAGAALPGIGQWVAPTLNPEELSKRIDELRTVQFWLEQNARMLGATIQALEVQRMTLSTLQSMNVPLADLHDTLKATLPKAMAPAATPAPAAPSPAPAPAAAARPDAGPAAAGKDAPAAAGLPAIDPMQWWTALSQQFTQLATQAIKDGSELKPGAPGKSKAAGGAPAGSKPRRPAARAPARKRAPASARKT
ncbi:MAG: PhaM family polyhydroxyalkanoate granule multifunctional regulatory protein [Burkholderiaceae bacterium]